MLEEDSGPGKATSEARYGTIRRSEEEDRRERPGREEESGVRAVSGSRISAQEAVGADGVQLRLGDQVHGSDRRTGIRRMQCSKGSL